MVQASIFLHICFLSVYIGMYDLPAAFPFYFTAVKNKSINTFSVNKEGYFTQDINFCTQEQFPNE